MNRVHGTGREIATGHVQLAIIYLNHKVCFMQQSETKSADSAPSSHDSIVAVPRFAYALVLYAHRYLYFATWPCPDAFASAAHNGASVPR